MKKNNQSRPMYPGARRQNQEGFLQKYFPWFALLATILCFWYKLEVTARITHLGWLITLAALAILTIFAFVAKVKGTTISGLWTSWRARRELDEDEGEGYNPPFDMPHMTMTEDEFRGYRPSVPVAQREATPKPGSRFGGETPVAPAPAPAPAEALPEGFVMLDEIELAEDLVKVWRNGHWVIEPSKEKEEGHTDEKYDKLTNTWVDPDRFIQLSIQRGIAEAMMGRQ